MVTKQKQIERDKELEKAAYAYSTKKCMGKMADKAINQYNKSNREEFVEAFIAGAKFADDFPRQGLVKIEDVRAIYLMWIKDINDDSDFLVYFYDYCKKEGWL